MPAPTKRPPQEHEEPRGKEADKRIPPDADVLFVESIRTGTVHVAVRLLPHHREPGRAANEPVASGGAAFITRALAPTVVRCGKRTWPHDPEARRHRFTDCFDDDQLCHGCYRTIHPGDQERLFEHAQSADPSNDGAAP